jgi:hypothetical protein
MQEKPIASPSEIGKQVGKAVQTIEKGACHGFNIVAKMAKLYQYCTFQILPVGKTRVLIIP